MESTHEATTTPRSVLFLVEFAPGGPRISHCKPSPALTELVAGEMQDRTPANLPEIGMRQLQDWYYAYTHGEWARGAHR
jgi:hypothetical protein